MTVTRHKTASNISANDNDSKMAGFFESYSWLVNSDNNQSRDSYMHVQLCMCIHTILTKEWVQSTEDRSVSTPQLL